MTIQSMEGDVELEDTDDPWAADPDMARDAEWTKLSSTFTDAGYREGITAGKEAALQGGFDDGFASVGVPLGRELGILRGTCSTVLAFLSYTPAGSEPESEVLVAEARDIAAQLSNIRFTDIAPRDLEAEEHALQHAALGDDASTIENSDLAQKRTMESLEDMLAGLDAGSDARSAQSRPTIDNIRILKATLQALCERLGLFVHLE